MLWSCRRLHLPTSLIVIWLVFSGVVVGGVSPLCPASCTCKPSDKGKRRISCMAGGLTDPIPTGQMDPRVEILEISAPELKKNWLSVTSIFQHFKQLEELRISQSNINQISMHAFWGIPTLKIINLSSNNISSIYDHNFRGLVNLIELDLSGNRITTLNSGVFKHLTELKLLNLERNQLKELIARTFLKLVKLHVLKISSNPFDELDPEAFKEIPDLRVLECRHCHLKRINTQIYHLLPYLTHLDLGYNSIQFLSSDEFIDLHKLHSLKLDGNQFPVILENTFINQQQLKYLNLARNRIAKIPDTSLKNLTSLVELDLGWNKLYKVESVAFTYISESLQKLTLSGNHINSDDLKGVVHTLNNVKELHLAYMKLKLIPTGFFQDNIISLNLSGNNLTELWPDSLPSHLKLLDISNNRFNSLNNSILKHLTNIDKVNLSSNPWGCDSCHLSPILHYLNKSDWFTNATCAFPSVLAGSFLVSINEPMECGSVPDSRVDTTSRQLYIGLLCLVTFAAASLMFVVCSCVKRHNQKALMRAKRTAQSEGEGGMADQTTSMFKGGISFQFPLDLMEKEKLAVATIGEIKRDEGNGSVVTGL